MLACKKNKKICTNFKWLGWESHQEKVSFKLVLEESLGSVGYISHVHWAYDYLGPFGVLWVHMAWHKNCVKKKGCTIEHTIMRAIKPYKLMLPEQSQSRLLWKFLLVYTMCLCQIRHDEFSTLLNLLSL